MQGSPLGSAQHGSILQYNMAKSKLAEGLTSSEHHCPNSAQTQLLRTPNLAVTQKVLVPLLSQYPFCHHYNPELDQFMGLLNSFYFPPLDFKSLCCFAHLLSHLLEGHYLLAKSPPSNFTLGKTKSFCVEQT